MGAEQPEESRGWFGPEQTAGLLDFWRVYDANYDAIIAETAPEVASGPRSGVGLRSPMPGSGAKSNAEIRAEARERLRRAIEDGDWAGYEADLRARAEAYAQHGLTFGGWHDTSSIFMCHVTVRVLRAYADDPQRAEAAALALQRFHDRRTIVLADHFLRAKERLAQDAAVALERSELDLREARKLATVGKLAGGIAHDFNNLLLVMGSHLELLVSSGAREAHTESVAQIQHACRRATELARQLLLFSRQQVVEQPVLDVADVVERAEKLLRQVLGVGVELFVPAARPTGRVRIDRVSLDQVIMNLVTNARDAMPNGGKITVESTDVGLGDGGPGNGGGYVLLSVSDEGTGMDEATRARIFEPFFTTKDPRKGTGLGLATVRGIVEQAGGRVTIRSEPGAGTTIGVYLPRVAAGVLANDL